jgi:archaellin
MKKTLVYLGLSILSISAFNSCSKQYIESDYSSKVHVKFSPTVGNENFELHKTYIIGDHKMNFELMKFYVSEMKLVSSDQKEQLKKVSLIDFGKSASTNNFSATVNEGKYDSLVFYIGLTPELNSTDPTKVETNHPQGTESNMYWAWETMYKFLSVEGKFNNKVEDNLNIPFTWHPGKAPLLKRLSFPLTNFKASSTTPQNLTINFDISQISHGPNPVDLKTETSTHSMTDEQIILAKKLMSNFVSGISVK